MKNSKTKNQKNAVKRYSKKQVFIRKLIPTFIVGIIFAVILVKIAEGGIYILMNGGTTGLSSALITGMVEKGYGEAFMRYYSSCTTTENEIISYGQAIYDKDLERVMSSERMSYAHIGSDDGSPSRYFMADESCESEIEKFAENYPIDEGYTVRTHQIYVSGERFCPADLYAISPENGEIVDSATLSVDIPAGFTALEMPSEDRVRVEYFNTDTESYVLKRLDEFVKGFHSEWSYSVYSSDFSAEMIPFTYNGEKYYAADCTLLNSDRIIRIVITYAAVLTLIICTIIAYFRAKAEYSMLNALYEMDDYRRDMTNRLAHDLKSPLMVISGYAENLENNINTEKREHYAGAICENVKYMNGIIENVLELSRLENCDTKPVITEFDAAEICAKLLADYEPVLDRNNITAVINGKAPFVTDKSEMAVMLDNIIGNAVKYTYKNGKILISCDKGRVMVVNDCADADSLETEELMKPFVKGDNSRSGRNGSGLGLSITKRAADLLGLKFSLMVNEGKFIAEISE